MKKRSAKTGARACCLDEASGLYTRSHFESVLSQELAKLDRWERPLCLVLLELPGLEDEKWAALGSLIRDSLRRIDLAARLGTRRAAVILPDADGARGRRWRLDFLAEMERRKLEITRPLFFGLALAQPWEGRQAAELLAMAEADLNDGESSAAAPGPAESGLEMVTAIAADERNLLFDGFKILGIELGLGEPTEA